MKTRFNTIRSRDVVLSNGEQSITLTVQRPPLLFGNRLDRAFPVLQEDTPAASQRLNLRAVLIAAEGIRNTEELPEPPTTDAGEQAWQAHAEEVLELFSEAGFLEPHINQLAGAALDLQSVKTEGKTDLKKAMDTAGND